MVISQKYRNELVKLLSIPSISAQSTHKKDMLKAADWLKNRFSTLGFTANIMTTAGHPVVYAEHLKAKNKPTILLYGHYDVQDPGDLNLWTTNPFKPEIRSGNIYSRGASDDKGQLYTWIIAIETILKQNKTLPLNIKFLIEGEEEVGSVNLDEFVEQNKSLLEADICALSDTHALNENQPMIDYGLRGIVYTEVHLKTLGKDSHSGLYGGNVLNPINVLSEIISRLKNSKHEITIPGFYDDVRKLTGAERNELSRLPFRENEVLEETGAEVVAGEEGFSVHERAGARPTLDVNGIWSGYQGEGPKTIIPAEAHAKISMRIVPNQTSRDVYEKFENYIQKITPKGVELHIKLTSGAEPVLFNKNNKYFKAAEAAYEKVFGNVPIYELSGGTIGVAATFKNILAIDCVLMGYGLPDDSLHGPNEKLSLSMFEKGVATNIEFLRNL